MIQAATLAIQHTWPLRNSPATGSHGRARFSGRDTVVVNGRTLEARHIVIAAGTEPVKLPIEGFDVDVRLVQEVKAVRNTGASFEVEVEAQGPGTHVVIATDLAIHSGGRAPALEALDLDAAGIAHDKGRLKLDETFRSTSNPAVYAAGGPLRLTPMAALEAHAVVDNLLGKPGAAVDYTGILSAVSTLPALTRVGLLEAEARPQDLQFCFSTS